ncbi:hypothetical protein HanRHA438_Chr08g0328781 [Helianthus annuus]|nr:hypothetical protein HanRHA438_Chr08g0328781 [Helianthus annuus]
MHRKPNQTVLEAQARVCTGPTQTKPLTEEQAFRVLDTILRSGTTGSIFRSYDNSCKCVSRATQWSEGERRAIDAYWPHLVRALPSDIVFLADPEGSI